MPAPDAPPALRGRSPLKRAGLLARRLHLYTGLFLFPWSILYGVTAFLFNHPTVASEAETRTITRGELAGTPLADYPPPSAIADAVVAELNRRAGSPNTYSRVGPEPKYGRDYAFATITAPSGELESVLIDPQARGGTIRRQPPPGPPAVGAPFATARETKVAPKPAIQPLEVPNLADAMSASLVDILPKLGYPVRSVRVTSVPDITFQMTDGATIYRVEYNTQTGAIGGNAILADPSAPSWRQTLLKMHKAHGYPPSGGGRWAWAVAVDLMAVGLVFWGLSGLYMWWQVRATRAAGAVVLALGVASAAGSGWALAASFAPM